MLRRHAALVQICDAFGKRLTGAKAVSSYRKVAGQPPITCAASSRWSETMKIRENVVFTHFLTANRRPPRLKMLQMPV